MNLADDRCWHKADMPTGTTDVCLLRGSGLNTGAALFMA